MRRPRRLLAMVLALATVLVIAAIWSGLRWHQAAADQARAEAHARDDALAAARRAAVSLSTLDYRHPERAVKSWNAASTGTLAKALASGKSTYQQLIKAGKVSTHAVVRGGAVQTLASNRRSAVVLLGLDVTLKPGAGKSTVQHQRLVVTMTRTAGGWRASAMQPVVAP